MSDIETVFTRSLTAVRLATAALPSDLGAVRGLDDDELVGAQRTLADARRALDASASLIAGEIGYRSRRELGYHGLAQSQGFRTPEKLVQHATGSTARDASTLVTVGTLIHDAETASILGPTAELREPWLLAVAVLTLLAEAHTMHADEILRRARQLRDELDVAGVAQREQQLRDERSIRRFRRPNGLDRYIIDPDIETAAFLDDLYDHATSPRRGNVSFSSEEDRVWADAVIRDARTTDQFVHDTVIDLLRIAVDSGSTATRSLIGCRQPAVRVLVTASALAMGAGVGGAGVGHVEGISIPVSMATVERIACANGTVRLTFDSAGNPLDLGREQRLFSARQRTVMAARDGGCLFLGCDRPPSWTEAHHIDHWQRDHGRTDVDRGVLLCRHHHMLVHNNRWEITHDDDGFHLIPPATIDPAQTPRRMPTKSAALRDLLSTTASVVSPGRRIERRHRQPA